MNVLNKFFPRFIGIDIGSASVKVVELARFGKKTVLKNYAHLESATYDGQPFRAFEKETLFLSSERAAEAIRACFDATEIHPQKVIFSLPDFSSFFVSFELPPMTGSELTKAINFHASKYVPIPMSEIVLDWKKINPSGNRKEEKGEPLHILAVAIPKKTMDQYRYVADLVGVSNFVLEPEAFSLFRIFSSQNGEALCVIDFGAKSTTLSFGDKNGLQSSHSLDVSSDKIVKTLQEKAGLSPEEAMVLLKKEGLTGKQSEIQEIIISALTPMVSAFNESWQSLKKKGNVVEKRPKILIVGGMALIPGLQEYLTGVMNAKVQIGNPFTGLEYPNMLEPIIYEIGPSFSVAIGAARRVF